MRVCFISLRTCLPGSSKPQGPTGSRFKGSGFRETKGWGLSLNGLSLAGRTVVEPQDRDPGKRLVFGDLQMPGSRHVEVCLDVWCHKSPRGSWLARLGHPCSWTCEQRLLSVFCQGVIASSELTWVQFNTRLEFRFSNLGNLHKY